MRNIFGLILIILFSFFINGLLLSELNDCKRNYRVSVEEQAKLKSSNDELSLKNQEIEIQSATLQQTNDELKVGFITCQAEKQSIQTQLAEAKQSEAGLRAQGEQLQAALQKTMLDLSNSLTERDFARDEAQRLNGIVQQLQSELNANQQALWDASVKVITLERQMNEKNDQKTGNDNTPAIWILLTKLIQEWSNGNVSNLVSPLIIANSTMLTAGIALVGFDIRKRKK